MFNEFNRRKKSLEKGIISGYIVVGISFVLFIPSAFINFGMPFVMMFFFAMGGVVSVYFNGQLKALSNEFKQRYVAKELEKIFPNSKYYYDYGFSEEEMIYSRLLKNQDRFYSEDMVEGEFDGVKFRCSDVKQQDVRGTGKDRRTVTVFGGRVYEFDFFKNFRYNLLILQPGQFRPFEGYNKIKMESINFNSELKVYAKDDHEAFYIITPQFMEKLLVLDRKYQDKISFSFKNSKLYIGIDNREDSFDIKPFVPVSNHLLDSYISEFDDMKEFIHLLTLNSKLFKD